MRIAAAVLALGLALAGGRASAQPVPDDLAQARAAFEAHDFETAYARYSALTASPSAAEADFVLSFIVKDGYGVVPADPAQALVLLRRAADAGEPRAIGTLGMAYLEGDGVPQSAEEAKRIWRRGAELNQAQSLYNLGYMARYADRAPAQAVDFFERAIAAGETNALADLADLLDRGEGVPQDSARAVELWRRAAAIGTDSARTKLVQAFYEGRGVARDPVKAQAWALVAEHEGDGISPEARNMILASLAPEQRAEAARLAKRCIAAPSTDCP